jgi:hypothetical protein
MTDLTAEDKQAIQEILKMANAEDVDRYKDRLAFFRKHADEKDLTTGRASYELGEYIDAAARSEYLLDQLNKITISNFTNAERQDFQERLERRQAQLTRNFKDLRAVNDLMVAAASSVVEIDTLLQSFNRVTQAQLKTTAAKPASNNRTGAGRAGLTSGP